MADDRQTAIGDADVELRVVLGTSMVRVRDLLKLGRGAVVELDRKVNAPSDIYVSGTFCIIVHEKISSFIVCGC